MQCQRNLKDDSACSAREKKIDYRYGADYREISQQEKSTKKS